MTTVNVTNFQRPKPLQTKEKPFYLFISFFVFNFFLSSSSIKHTLHNIYTYFQWKNTKHTFFVDVCGSVSIRARHIRNNQQNRQQHNHCTWLFFSYYFVHQNRIETCVMPEITIIKIPFQLMEEIHSIQNATKKRMKRETFLFDISIEKVTFDVESFKSIPFSSECHRSFCWVKNISMRKIHIQSEWFSTNFFIKTKIVRLLTIFCFGWICFSLDTISFCMLNSRHIFLNSTQVQWQINTITCPTTIHYSIEAFHFIWVDFDFVQ